MGEVGRRTTRDWIAPSRSRGSFAARVADDTHHERFRREALTLSRLSHSGIATVFDFESAGDHDLLVMEFVPGGTLESRLREGPLPLDGGPVDRRVDRRRAGGCAPARRSASRPQAWQCRADQRWPAEDSGLRSGAAGLRRGDDRTADTGGDGDGLAGLHGTRTARRRGRGRAHRRLRARCDAVRACHRAASVFAGAPSGPDVRDHQYACAVTPILSAGRHSRSRRPDRFVPREGPGRRPASAADGRGSIAAGSCDPVERRSSRHGKGRHPRDRGPPVSQRLVRILRRNTSPTG